MPRLRAANNAGTLLNEDISSGDGTVEVLDASSFPAPPFRVTIYSTNPAEGEIVEVTEVNGNVLSIDRGKEGTVPDAWSIEDKCILLQTAGYHNDHLDDRRPHLLFNDDESEEYCYGFVIENGILNMVYEEVS